MDNMNPYEQMPTGYQEPKQQKKKKSNFGKRVAKVVALGLIFGIVSGSVFTGVSYAGTKLLGINGTKTEASKTPEADVDAIRDAFGATGEIQQTSTGATASLADVSQIVSQAMPSVVAITNIGTYTYESFFGTQTYEDESCGSGIIIKQDENYLYIVTNNHVVENANSLTVQFSDGNIVSGEIQGTYSASDLAVVRVALESISAETKSVIKIASLGDSDGLKVGEAAIAIGNALGYGQSVTTGVVSALNREVTVSDTTTGQTVIHDSMIQTDAAINPGNSGGALLNAKGEVIGINSVKYADTDVEGFGYAIPINEALPIIDKLINKQNVGEEQTAYLGIQGQDVSADVAQVYNMPQGVYVYDTVPGAAAQLAGIRQGDIITALDGQKVTSMEGLKELLTFYSAGETVSVTLQRLGNGYEEMQVEVTLSSSAQMNQ